MHRSRHRDERDRRSLRARMIAGIARAGNAMTDADCIQALIHRY